jgi:hypothetical protein
MFLYFGISLISRLRMVVFGLVLLAVQAYAVLGAVVARLERPNRGSAR